MSSTDTRATVAQQIEKYKITMIAQRIEVRPDDNGNWSEGATHFLVTLEREGRKLTTFYSMGSAHLDHYVLERARKAGEYKWEQVKGDIDRAFRGANSVFHEGIRNRFRSTYGKGFTPDIVGVVDSLILDAAGVENVGGFEEWASEYGYDTDSRKAEEGFKACGKIRDDLRKMMGSRAAFEDLINNTEGE